MKVFLETTYIKQQHYTELINYYQDIEFVFEVDPACEILVGFYEGVPDKFFDQFKHLKLVILISSGYDHLNLSYMKQRNIIVTNAKGLYDIQIAEDVVAKMLYFNRNIIDHQKNMDDHIWKHQPQMYELYEQQALILGAGSIGQAIAKRLKGFDMETIGYKKSYEEVPYFDKIITCDKELNAHFMTCDYVVISLPLNKYTRHMINEKTLSLMKPSTLIINIGRGEIIDQDALIKALNEGVIRGAAIDVTYPEPLPENDPLWDAKNLFITPHNASASPMVTHRRMALIIKQIDLFISNKQLFNVVL